MELPPDNLPSIGQIIIWGLFAIGGLGAGFIGYRQKPRPTDPDNVIIDGVSIADMSPVREVAKALHRSANAHERQAMAQERQASAAEAIRDIMHESAEEAEVERRVRERLDALSRQ